MSTAITTPIDHDEITRIHVNIERLQKAAALLRDGINDPAISILTDAMCSVELTIRTLQKTGGR